jgi:ABC-type branched-subunit amino acid transport system substrate-binding protein
MFALLSTARKAILSVFALGALVWIASCTPTTVSGPTINTSAPVQVALLVPIGTGDATDGFLAGTLENAARMAIADLQGVTIDLRVYDTGADAAQAAAAASRAVDEGARIILGPLYAEAANAAGIAVRSRGVNVLTFSNNPSIAGGNVFVLGATFENTAKRLATYAASTGFDRIMVVHGDDVPGAVGRDAIVQAIVRSGATLAGVESYPLSQQGILDASSLIAENATANSANALFLTAGVNADLPIVATVLPEHGINPATVRYIGLTRWDVTPQALSLPGLQGGIFAMPDTSVSTQFDSRYAATFGGLPHPLAGLAYDGIAAIGALIAAGNRDALTARALTQPQGFQGTAGIFRLLPDGTNERGLAVAQIQNNQVVIVDPAPRSFARTPF